MDENALTITPAQRREVLAAFGLDPDLTVSCTIAADWITAVVADVDADGALRMTGGHLVTRNLSVPIRDPEPEPDVEPESMEAGE